MIQTNESVIHCKAKLYESDKADKIGSGILLTLPNSASAKLPSRGMAMVEGTMNGFHFQAALEPDGKGSHWFKLNDNLLKGAKVSVGDTVVLVIEASKEWPEPKVPADLHKALTVDSQAHVTWLDITPMARWDWIRWIGAAKQQKTRERRIEVTCSKLRAGKRRPCCFDRTECTLTDA